MGTRFRKLGESQSTTVTGVAEDIAMTGLSAATRLLQVYRPLPRKLRSNTLALRLEDGRDPAALLPLVRSTT